MAALFCESVKIKGDKGVEKPLGESGLYCEGGTNPYILFRLPHYYTIRI